MHTVDKDAYRRRDFEKICTCAVAAGSFSDQCKHVLRVLVDFGLSWDCFLKPWNTVQAWELQVPHAAPNLPASHAKQQQQTTCFHRVPPLAPLPSRLGSGGRHRRHRSSSGPSWPFGHLGSS